MQDRGLTGQDCLNRKDAKDGVNSKMNVVITYGCGTIRRLQKNKPQRETAQVP